MFLITGCPRSGTLYTARVFQELGYSVSHEGRYFKGKEGVVSWYAASRSGGFDVVIHQTRDPLKTIGSMFTLRPASFAYLEGGLGVDLRGTVLIRVMTAWLGWSKLCDWVSTWRYQVEELGDVYAELFERLGWEAPKKLPRVSKKTNSRRDKASYRRVKWKDLEGAEPAMAREIRTLAEVYGYESG